MSEKEEKPTEEPETDLSTQEEVVSGKIPEKKETTEEEIEEIFGEDAEPQEPDPFAGKTELETAFLKETGKMPQEWVKAEMERLWQTEHNLVANWGQINDWIKQISYSVDIAKTLSDKVLEFCPDKCMNTYAIQKEIFFISDESGEKIDYIPTACINCPLLPYGLADATENLPDEIMLKLKVGDPIPQEVQLTEETQEKDSETGTPD